MLEDASFLISSSFHSQSPSQEIQSLDTEATGRTNSPQKQEKNYFVTLLDIDHIVTESNNTTFSSVMDLRKTAYAKLSTNNYSVFQLQQLPNRAQMHPKNSKDSQLTYTI